jgi:cobalt/nickel transport system permease protein
MLDFSPKIRLYISLLLVVGTALLKVGNWMSLSIYIVISFVWVVLLGIQIKRLSKILSLQLVFLFILVLPGGWERAGFLLVRSMVCLIFLTSFLLSLPPHSFGTTLRNLPLPAQLRMNLYFSGHFLEILMDELEKMNLSAQLRGLSGTTSWLRYTNASMVGALYIRTLDKVERINKAMYLRGFNGEFPPELILIKKESYILFGVAFLVIITTVNSYLLA